MICKLISPINISLAICKTSGQCFKRHVTIKNLRQRSVCLCIKKCAPHKVNIIEKNVKSKHLQEVIILFKYLLHVDSQRLLQRDAVL